MLPLYAKEGSKSPGINISATAIAENVIKLMLRVSARAAAATIARACDCAPLAFLERLPMATCSIRMHSPPVSDQAARLCLLADTRHYHWYGRGRCLGRVGCRV